MIEIENLEKSYGPAVAVERLSLRIETGDAFGFIGPNGAGKTTTIKILATLLEPSAGTVLINGYCAVEEPEKVREVLGYMPDHFGVYDGMRVWEYLDFFAAAYRKPRGQRLGLVADVLELTDMTPRRNDFVDALSVGLKQRLCLAKTLIHDPSVLVLDEPASGLDPRARIEFRELMKELTRLGKTLFVSSHILPELADFCNKIGIIEGGRLLEFGEVDEVTARVESASYRVVNVRVIGEPAAAREILQACPQLANVREQNGRRRSDGTSQLQAEFSGTLDDMPALVDRLVAEKVRLVGFWEEKTDLEDVFMKITRGGVGGGAHDDGPGLMK
ncbi:MAG: ABC transporter ATP-binding protein [Armatimonadetes bacterium]|nr:ABC transporter ATP-binding protein [Armatimonadota bacterium]